MSERNDERDQRDQPADADEEQSGSADALPGEPAEDDAEVGDTDQHSDA